MLNTPIDKYQWDEAEPQSLGFDAENPRFVDRNLGDEDDIIKALYDEADVSELIQSILTGGYLDFEPLIVLENDNVVLEGNRRLAALRLIDDAALRDRLRIELPVVANPYPVPDKVRIIKVSDRTDARGFIGFKHINGPFKWDALAKAQYAAQWFQEGGNIQNISRTLGDNHSTVRRLVNGWYALEQAKNEGFDVNQRTKKSFSFSHLYTAITRASVRDFLGLRDDDPLAPPGTNPVPAENIPELLELMSWLYGQGSNRSIIESQNPNLNQLSKVLANAEATQMLRGRRDLASAFERAEPPSARFEDALVKMAHASEDAMKLSPYFEGDETLMRIAENTEKTVHKIIVVMRSTSDTEDN